MGKRNTQEEAFIRSLEPDTWSEMEKEYARAGARRMWNAVLAFIERNNPAAAKFLREGRPPSQEAEAMTVRYTNYRGEESVRRIAPQRYWYGSTKWHPQPQWLVDALDVDRNVVRSFALRDMQVIDHPSTNEEQL